MSKHEPALSMKERAGILCNMWGNNPRRGIWSGLTQMFWVEGRRDLGEEGVLCICCLGHTTSDWTVAF